MNAPVFNARDMLVGRRASPRLRLHVPAELVLVDGRLRCLLDDISRTGAQLSLPRAVPCHADAVLTCGRIECFGEIVWTGDNHCGIQFDQPLTQAMVIAMRSIGDDLAEAELAERRRAAYEWVAGGTAKP